MTRGTNDPCRHLERLTALTILRGTLTCQTGLHIGSGGQVAPGASDLPVVKDGVGRPFVPGSSLKGVLRTFAERIVASLTPVDPAAPPGSLQGQVTSCWLHAESSFCLSTCKAYREEFDRQREGGRFRKDDELTEWVCARTCAVCRLFGSPYLAGRVWVKDAFLSGEFVPLEVRKSVAIDRDRRTAAAHLLYDLEAVPPASAFDIEIRVENASTGELGLLFTVLDQLNDGGLRLGGRGSAGLGKVQVAPSQLIHLAEDSKSGDSYRERLLNYLLGSEKEKQGVSGNDLTTFWDQCKEAFGEWIWEGWTNA